jgi:hypothetical protein
VPVPVPVPRFANSTAVPAAVCLYTASMFPSALVTAVEGCAPLWSIAMMSGFFSAASSAAVRF